VTTDAPPRILVVDDEENIRFLVGSALQPAGFVTALAGTGCEALDADESGDPKLIPTIRGLGFSPSVDP
jgi:two-component system OmpR family response regulator